MSKTFKIVDGDMSDGYHTFDELYEHRVALFLALVKVTSCPAYYKPDHYPEWDAVYLELPTGQVSYHVPALLRGGLLGRAEEVGEEYGWDGHSSADVVDRLRGLLVAKWIAS